MERREQQDETAGDETITGYEPPVVEDLDTSHGPVATPAGVKGSTTTTAAAAPREI